MKILTSTVRISELHRSLGIGFADTRDGADPIGL
jgi:hypothetical protein